MMTAYHQNKVSSFALRGLLLLMCCFVIGCAPLKVTDPTSPKFVESDFKFEDYAEFRKFRQAMEVMFPVGTPKERIDRILVGSGGAKSYAGAQDVKINRVVAQGDRIVRYIKPNRSGIFDCTFRVRAVINSQDLLSQKIDASYGCK